jgi:hypothetical protein
MTVQAALPIPSWSVAVNPPPIQLWAVDVGFSPTGAWDREDLLAAFSEPTQLLSASSETLLRAFLLELTVHNQQVSTLPTAQELVSLVKRTAKRTKKQEAEISAQVSPMTVKGAVVAAGVGKLRPALNVLIDAVLEETRRPILYCKFRLNRVRAYQLLTQLAPLFLGLDFPMHPSFPSGHSTQAHLVANVLEDVFGVNGVKRAARKMAWHIGRNRELAGLHYPSDTKAGEVLARVLQTHLQGPRYAALCKNARSEYP